MKLAILFLACLLPAIAANSYSSTILATPGLVGYWRLGESSGNFADSSTNASTATASGSLTYSQTGVIVNDTNTSIQFNSTGIGTVSSSTPYNFEYNQAFSAECWYKEVSSGNYACVGKKLSGSVATGWELHVYNDTPFVAISNSESGNKQIEVDAPALTPLTSGVWYHLAFTYDGSGVAAGVRLYINGSAVSGVTVHDTLASNTIQSAASLTIGGRNGCCLFNGTLDEVAVYNVALTGLQIQNHYNLGLATLYPFPFTTSAPINLIYDNDGAVDIGNFWGFSSVMSLARLGYVNLLGVINTDSNVYSATCYDLIARYAGYVTTVGSYQGSSTDSTSYTGCATYAGTYAAGRTRSSYSSDSTVYRNLLTAAANSSVTLVVAGPAQGLYDLMNDGNSPSGVTLITNKVKKVCWSAGGYTSGTEYNFSFNSNTALTANYVLLNWPNTVPVDFISNTTSNPGGNNISDGVNIYSIALPGSPLYQLLNNNARGAAGRPIWDDMALLDCLSPSLGYFSTGGSNGTNAVTLVTGANSWTSTPNNNMNYVVNSQINQFYANILNLFLYRDNHMWGATW
jgi:hypothetical protein